MQLLKIMLVLVALFVLSTGITYAAANPDNPNNVAYYDSGLHAIPLDPIIWLNGYDLVMANGQSGNFNQWFWNNDVAYHSVWNVTKNGSCEHGVLIPNANPVGPDAGWGHYLVEGADYCVITNQYEPPHNQ